MPEYFTQVFCNNDLTAMSFPCDGVGIKKIGARRLSVENSYRTNPGIGLALQFVNKSILQLGIVCRE